MKEMDRLIDQCDDDFTRALLEEGRRPLDDSRRTARVLAAVGAGGLVMSKSGWAAASSWKQMVVATAVSVSGGVAAYQLLHRTPEAAVVQAKSVSNINSAGQVPSEATPATEPAPGSPQVSKEVNTLPTYGEPVNELPRAEAVKVNGKTNSGRGARGSTLGQEVAMLDKARGLMKQGKPEGALSVLDRYRAEYPNGSLSLEAELVRIPALARLGRKKEASERAARLLARKPNSVVAEQLRAYILP